MNKNKQCILCPYKKEENCLRHDKCYSISNIYYGMIGRFFPFKQIQLGLDAWRYRRYCKYLEKMDKKYGNHALEDDDYRFVWGVKSWDDLTSADACMYTMNDIDITYDKKRQLYMLGVETAYWFENHAAECDYLQKCLAAFMKYMDDNGLNKNEPYRLFMSNPCTSMEAESVEYLYTNFKVFVDGYYNQNIDMENNNDF